MKIATSTPTQPVHHARLPAISRKSSWPSGVNLAAQGSRLASKHALQGKGEAGHASHEPEVLLQRVAADAHREK